MCVAKMKVSSSSYAVSSAQTGSHELLNYWASFAPSFPLIVIGPGCHVVSSQQVTGGKPAGWLQMNLCSCVTWI